MPRSYLTLAAVFLALGVPEGAADSNVQSSRDRRFHRDSIIAYAMDTLIWVDQSVPETAAEELSAINKKIKLKKQMVKHLEDTEGNREYLHGSKETDSVLSASAEKAVKLISKKIKLAEKAVKHLEDIKAEGREAVHRWKEADSQLKNLQATQKKKEKVTWLDLWQKLQKIAKKTLSWYAGLRPRWMPFLLFCVLSFLPLLLVSMVAALVAFYILLLLPITFLVPVYLTLSRTARSVHWEELPQTASKAFCAMRLCHTFKERKMLKSTQVSDVSSYALVEHEPTDESECKAQRLMSLGPAVRSEALWLTLSPVLGIIMGLATSLMHTSKRRAKVPPWVLILLVPLVLRGKYAEVGLVRAANLNQGDDAISACTLLAEDFARFPPPLLFTLSALEMLDAPSDGIAIASASLSGPEVHRRFVESYRQGLLAFMVPVVDRLGIFGCMGVTQLIASVSQTGIALSTAQAAADIGGLGALSRRIAMHSPELLEAVHNSEQSFDLVRNLVNVRVLLETAPQMLWQTSLIMASGHGFLDQPALAFSIAISFLAMTKKVMEQMIAGRKLNESISENDIRRDWLFPVLPMLMFLIYMAMRLYMMEACPSHSWGISTGCVSF